MADSISQWRVTCRIHGQQITYSATEPESCPVSPTASPVSPTTSSSNPTDSNHNLDKSKTVLLRTWSPEEVILKEDPISTDRGYGITTINIVTSAMAGSITSVDRRLRSDACPIDTYLSSTAGNATLDNTNDIINVYVAPNTPAGLITADTPAGSTEIPVTITGPGPVAPGLLVSVGQAKNIGYIVAVTGVGSASSDPGSVIQLGTPLTDPISAGTMFQTTTHLADNCVIPGPGYFSAGDDTTRTSFLPAGSVIRVTYKNVSGGVKRFGLFVKYKY